MICGPRGTGSENFDLIRDDRQVRGFHDSLLGQLFRVIGSRKASQNETLVLHRQLKTPDLA